MKHRKTRNVRGTMDIAQAGLRPAAYIHTWRISNAAAYPADLASVALPSSSASYPCGGTPGRQTAAEFLVKHEQGAGEVADQAQFLHYFVCRISRL